MPWDSQWRENFRNLDALYNLFENSAPYTGHLALDVGLCIASKHLLGEDRGFSIFVIGDSGSGKSLVASQFLSLPNVIYSDQISKSRFCQDYLGKYLTRIGSHVTPDGVSRKDEPPKFDNSKAEELIDNRTFIAQETQLFAAMHDPSLQQFFAFLGSLAGEGYSSIGDDYNGKYVVGGPEHPRSFNIAMFGTQSVWKRFQVTGTFRNRLIPQHYQCLRCEIRDVQRKIEYGILNKAPKLHNEVKNILYNAGLRPEEKKVVKFDSDAMKLLSLVTNKLMDMRASSWTGGQEVDVGKRDAKYARSFVGSMALFNGRADAIREDVVVCLALLNSVSATKMLLTNENTGQTYEQWNYAASKAHFLVSLCESTMQGFDTHGFLSQFENFEGKPVYSKEDINRVYYDLGMKV